MRKWKEVKGDEALDMMADLLEPAAKIFSDKETIEGLTKEGEGRSRARAAKLLIKRHKAEVQEILAILDGENPATYEINLFTLPLKLLEVLNDEDLQRLFFSQEQSKAENASGSVTEKQK